MFAFARECNKYGGRVCYLFAQLAHLNNAADANAY